MTDALPNDELRARVQDRLDHIGAAYVDAFREVDQALMPFRAARGATEGRGGAAEVGVR